MRRLSLIWLTSASVMLSGCLAKTVVDVATLPVRAAGKAVDLATTSQAEADEKRGRELRKREQRLGKLERVYAKQRARCDDGSEQACAQARTTYAQIEEIRPMLPGKPEHHR